MEYFHTGATTTRNHKHRTSCQAERCRLRSGSSWFVKMVAGNEDKRHVLRERSAEHTSACSLLGLAFAKEKSAEPQKSRARLSTAVGKTRLRGACRGMLVVK
ncbi:hypothetical protein M3J09_011669 [Ascochyta lentis]